MRVHGKRAAKGDRVAAGDDIELAYAPATGDDLRPVADHDAAARLVVLVELPELIVVDKPAGMPSQPLRAGERGTAANGIAARWPECTQLVSPDMRDGGLVHRLDVGTSGALAAARTQDHYTRAARRRSRAATSTSSTSRSRAAGPRRRAARRRSRSAAITSWSIAVDGLAAYTEFVVERTSATHALVRCVARTGRMHQVRAHLARVGAPIAGDALYGGPPLVDDGFFLHAARLAIPADGKDAAVVVDASIPERFATALAACGLAKA